MEYLILLEPTSTGYSAYCPDVPGCTTAGETLEATRQNMVEALQLHFEGMRTDGLEIPQPTSVAAHVEV